MSDSITVAGVTYHELPSCSYGDYGGSGSIGLANILSILDDNDTRAFGLSFGDLSTARQFPNTYGSDTIAAIASTAPNVLDISGSYNSRAVYVGNNHPSFEDLQSALADYPVLDDNLVSQIEMDWESDAFDSYARRDLLDGFRRATVETLDTDSPEYLAADARADQADDLSDETLFGIYRQAMEGENEYPVVEYSSSHIPVDRIQSAFNRLLAEILPRLFNTATHG